MNAAQNSEHVFARGFPAFPAPTSKLSPSSNTWKGPVATVTSPSLTTSIRRWSWILIVMFSPRHPDRWSVIRMIWTGLDESDLLRLSCSIQHRCSTGVGSVWDGERSVFRLSQLLNTDGRFPSRKQVAVLSADWFLTFYSKAFSAKYYKGNVTHLKI